MVTLDKGLSELSYVKGLKSAGVGLGVVSAAATVTQVLYNSQINASNVLDAVVTGVSFIPGIGWAIGGGFFVADLITRGVTGQSIGQHLDDAVGQPLFDWDW